MTTKQRPQRRGERARQELQTGATGGIGFGARIGQIIRGALGRGAGGQFVRAADRETLRERDARLRAILAAVRAFMRTPTATERAATGGGKAGARTRQKRASAAERRAKNRRDTVERIVSRGWIELGQANAFLAFIEDGASDEQLVILETMGLIDADGNLTRAGRLLKTAYDREKLDIAKRALDMLEGMEEKALKQGGAEGSLRRELRSAVRGLWLGVIDEFDFFEGFSNSITKRLTQAWNEGAAQCGIRPDELTREELNARRRLIEGQIRFVDGYADGIIQGSKANGGLLRDVMGRVDMWVSQYNVARTTGNGMACADQKGMWVLDPEKENCGSCIRLNGKVKRNSFWIESGILPQVNGASYLECRGFKCGCVIRPTKEPVSRGPLPSLP